MTTSLRVVSAVRCTWISYIHACACHTRIYPGVSAISHATSHAMPCKVALRVSSTLGGAKGVLTHTDEVTGKASMVDVSDKVPGALRQAREGGGVVSNSSVSDSSVRSATASAKVWLGSSDAYRLVKENVNRKGDVLGVAQLAGIMGAKQTSQLIPLCHPLLVTHVDTRLALNDVDEAVDIVATVKTVGPTGVEMEALTAASVAALTVYDMCKAASMRIRITDVFLVEKLGGKRGHYRYDEDDESGGEGGGHGGHGGGEEGLGG
jgi:cyclic pyranopterin phosphate synthase